MRWLPFVFGSLLAAQVPVAVPEGSGRGAIVQLAASVRPSARQVAWQRTGCNAFVHFGMNTFTDREWGEGNEDPRTFAPSDFDAAQWVTSFRSAGMSGLLLTAKHHDGFCLWPSATTQHSVRSSRFRDGKGDVVGEVAAACRAGGMQFGVYLSPWDRSQPSFGTAAYQKIFLQQLRELCSNYGPLFEVWFDGAHCPPDDPELFDWQAVFQLVRELQPDAAISITGPDVRWVGNEAGRTRAEEWSVLPLRSEAPGAFDRDRASWRALWELRARNQDQDLGSRKALEGAKALCWWAAETDVSIRPGWFHHAAEDAHVKSLPTLLDYWFGAVGGNAVLLLNVPADRRGRIAEPDAAVLRDLGSYLAETFGSNLAAGAETKQYPKVGEVCCKVPTTVDTFDLGEDIAAAGQCVEEFRIEVLQNGGWRECARGTTIGMRRILRTDPITGDGFRYWIERSRGKSRMAHFALYRRPALLQPPTIERSAAGLVTIAAEAGDVRFTLDGTPVTVQSPRYTEPFALVDGGIVRAGVFRVPGSGEPTPGTSVEAAAIFGIASLGWKVLDCSSQQGGREAAEKAFDGDPRTHWHSRYSPETAQPPHHLAIDLGRAVTVRGFVYQPRAEGSNGSIADYEFDGSSDGVTWQRLAKGTFGNIDQNPVPRQVEFEPVPSIRYVRLTALREALGRPWASCAELSVLAR
jgi:alpha-L-fucosidase